MKNKIQNIYDNPSFYEGYRALRQNKEGFNEQLEQPAIISLLPPLNNLMILDVGCGFGDFARYAIEHGAFKVIGIDPSEKMIAEAKKLTNNSNIHFQQCAIEKYETVLNTFDLVISSLAFHYVDNLNEIIIKIFSWIKPGGYLIFSVEHPIRTASLEYPEIMTDTDGVPFHPVYNYRDEILLHQYWFVENVQKYHRTVSTYINTVIECGFKIEKILEPMPSDKIIRSNINFAAHKIRPPILVLKARKI